MNELKLKWMMALCALTASAALAATEEVTLRVGDAAPKLATGKWVQGEPVKDFEKGKAYLVEFWATWCGPCKVSIPHLNEIHNKFKDKGLVVIGSDCWERDETLVEPFLKTMGEKMTYRVSLDNKTTSKKGRMAESWMDAAGRNGIPSAFLVNTEGKIAWIGHPMELQESVIEQVLAGKYDVAKAAADYEQSRKEQAHKTDLSRQLSTSIQKKEWAKAESALDEIEKTAPKSQHASLEVNRVRILVGKGDNKAAAKLANELSDDAKDNISVQAMLASVFSGPNASSEDLDLAVQFATRSNEAAKGKNPFVLASLAQLTYKQGKKDKAIGYQEQAVGLAEGKYKESLEKTLATYKAEETAKAK
jgi:thiol-disulfide isomerase/thioredoxin